jgi:hypothetical protein
MNQELSERIQRGIRGKLQPKTLPRTDEYPEDQRGDAWEPPPEVSRTNANNGRAEGTNNGRSPPGPSLAPIPEPAPLSPAAFHGPVGDLVRLIEPHSEADPVALLGQTLVALGSCIGRNAHFVVENDTHYLNLNLVLVGVSSKGRKGSSWGHVRDFFSEIDPEWADQRIQSGLSSGEGLIWAVRDRVTKEEPIKDKGRVIDYQEVQVDPGVADKRLLCYESEFASVLKVAERQGNTLSVLIRQAWETGDLRSMTKNCPAQATGAHISVIGHITNEELVRCLSATEQANGFGNRFIWLAVKRSKLLPEGGCFDGRKLFSLREQFQEALLFGRHTRSMVFDAEARDRWIEGYERLSEGWPGLAGSLLARAEAQVRRLASLYAVADLTAVVAVEHLEAALALWQYAAESVRFIFGDSLGNPAADELLVALKMSPEGLSRTRIYHYFNGHRSSLELRRALGLLQSLRLAHCKQIKTEGRPSESWFLGPAPA